MTSAPDSRNKGEGYLPMVGDLPSVVIDNSQDGPRMFSKFRSVLQFILTQIVARINGQLTLGSGDHNTLSGNLKGLRFNYTAPSVANTEFTIPHNLGYVPTGFLVVWSDRACHVYAAASTLTFNSRTLTLGCDVADAQLKLWIF